MRIEEQTTRLLTGWWWRPEYPQDMVPGTAYLQADGRIELELLDSFREGITRQKKSRPIELHIDTLIGLDSDQEQLFLFDVAYIELKIFFSPEQKRISIAYAPRFIQRPGRRMEDPFTIREANVEIEGLFDWIGEDHIDMDWNDKSVSINYPRQKVINDLQVELEDCLVEFVLSAEGVWSYGKSVDFKSRAYVRLRSKEGLSHERFVYLVRLVCDFFSLAHNRWTHIAHINVSDVVFDHDNNLTWMHSGMFSDQSLPMIDRSKANEGRNINRLFNVEDVREQFPAILATWIKRYDELSIIYDVYSSVERASFLYLETKFLSYVRAVEGFFRWKHPDSRFVDQEELEGWVNAEIQPLFKNKYSGKEGKKLTDHTIHLMKTMANRWPLERILVEVESWRSKKFIERLISSVQTATKSDRRKLPANDFVYRIANTRNTLSHGLKPNSKTIAPGSREFLQAIDYLRILLQAALLEIAGFENNQIDQLLLNRYTSGL